MLPKRKMRLPRPIATAVFDAVRARDDAALARLRKEHPDLAKRIRAEAEALRLLDRALGSEGV